MRVDPPRALSYIWPMSSTRPADPGTGVPPVDLRLVAPESRYEIQDGRIVYVPPSDEPHGSRHSKLSALLEAHVGDSWDVASDMLTRTSETDDVAPDASVFPRERDPETGRRQLEELAFEVASTETLNEVAIKAKKLADRGVRRIFAIDVSRQRAFEWSLRLGTWEILAPNAVIEDVALAAPLPVEALVRAAKADDAMARALLKKRNPVLQSALADQRNEGRAEGGAEILLKQLTKRFGPLQEAVVTRVRTASVEELDRFAERVLDAESLEDVIR